MREKNRNDGKPKERREHASRENVVHMRETRLREIQSRADRCRELEEQCRQLTAEIASLKDRLLRMSADFDNFRKRTERDRQDLLRYGVEQYVLQLLPFDDIFEKVLHQLDIPSVSPDAIHSGLTMLRKEFARLLKDLGVRRIETTGAVFDPAVHEAGSVIETGEVPENTVVEEERAGYLLHDRVVRPAIVKVSRKAPVAHDGNDEGREQGPDQVPGAREG